MDEKERTEVKELRRIANSMGRSRDGHGVARQYQEAKELADTLDWVREMNRRGSGIDEGSIVPAEGERVAFPDCIALTEQGDQIGVELTSPGGRWNNWTEIGFREMVERTIEKKSQKAKSHRRDGTCADGLDRLVLLLTVDMDECQAQSFLEAFHVPDTSEFDGVYVMLDYKPDGAGGRHPVFRIKGPDVLLRGQSSREPPDQEGTGQGAAGRERADGQEAAHP